MHISVLTASKSQGIAEGLTYASAANLEPGMCVRVPLRKKIVDGIVLGVEKQLEQKFTPKEIEEVIGGSPLLSRAQVQTAKWISEYYQCSLRKAISLFLPFASWKNLLKEDSKQVPSKDHALPEFTLNAAQKHAYEVIQKSEKPSLLFGVTGSGKTHIYALLIADAIKAGGQAILLVPEILLSEDAVRKFTQWFGEEQIALLHSKLTAAQKRKEWLRIRSEKAKLIIGSRSALFAPAQNLTLVILDEEHEWTFKSEQTPRYHAREVAQALCGFARAKLVLGSATPSLESWKNAKDGIYTRTNLPERFTGMQAPTVQIIDLGTVNFANHYPLSPTLLQAIESRLAKKEQCILFLNRRGIATSVLCMDCRERLSSDESGLPLTLHRYANGSPYLLDHFTGSITPVPGVCPSCSSVNLRSVGAGTQKLEDIVRAKFPRARVLRADSDTLKRPEEMHEILSAMKQGEADILLGTQSIVKGLDLPNVTLAAVLLADIGLSLPHFRSGERVFQLLTQLIGRSGRHKPGHVIIQTFRPEALEILASAKHETEKYLANELTLRTKSMYPPAVEMARILFRGNSAREHALACQKALMKHEHLRTSAAPTFFGGGTLWHVLVRGNGARKAVQNIEHAGIVDIDPLNCL